MICIKHGWISCLGWVVSCDFNYYRMETKTKAANLYINLKRKEWLDKRKSTLSWSMKCYKSSWTSKRDGWMRNETQRRLKVMWSNKLCLLNEHVRYYTHFNVWHSKYLWFYDFFGFSFTTNTRICRVDRHPLDMHIIDDNRNHIHRLVVRFDNRR